jgi:PAS domain S-box-containing protein
MISPLTLLTAIVLYMVLLFAIARWVERKTSSGRSPAHHPLIYSLSLAVYCTAWTYYGSVGKAATSGSLFLAIYLGPTIVIVLWWHILRKLIRLKNTFKITSIADFISARYNRSQPLAALAAIIAIVGITPYISLQLKAILSTFALITPQPMSGFSAGGAAGSLIGSYAGPIIIGMLILFTIVLGVRRLDPTERHEGMVTALAAECLVKLLALMAAGVFVTYFMNDGFSGLFRRFFDGSHHEVTRLWSLGTPPYLTWSSYLVLSASAILFLPRQFHVAVVENSSEKHILTAMWMFPLYMLLINIFVFPIAMAGLLEGHPVEQADNFVLLLPLEYGEHWLSLVVFLGGFSAAAGMIMVSSITIATMTTNHLLLPMLGWSHRLDFLKRHLLKCRWVVVTGFILSGYWFKEAVTETYMLANIGLISFAAVFQFAPAILGGLYWRRGNAKGSMLGMSAGFLAWCYTQLLPSFARNGWLSRDVLDSGPWGIEFLKPESLFGLTGLDPISHTVVVTTLLNVGLYVFGSLYFEQTEEEQRIAEEFVGAMDITVPLRGARRREASIDLNSRLVEIKLLLGQYFHEREVEALIDKSLHSLQIAGKTWVTVPQFVELYGAIERYLSGSIGTAAAHNALQEGIHFTPAEAQELAEIYAEVLANLKVTPTELKVRIDYHQEREKLLLRHARELEEKVNELEREIQERTRVQNALQHSEKRFRGLVESMNEGLEIEDEKGFITYVNQKLCRMLGYEEAEIIGSPVARFLDVSQREIFERHCKMDISGICSYEIVWKGREDKQIPTIVSSVPFFDQEGNHVGGFSVITDISHIKSLERERANMVSMFAHDMRSSLTGIHGLAHRLQNRSVIMDEEKRSEYLKVIDKEASKLEYLMDDFLEFSRLEAGRLKLKLSTTSLDQELRDIFDIYQPRALQRNLVLELDMESELPVIEADANRLRRVFTNLLDNALKFSREQGTIKIEAMDSAQEILVSISDEGIGIDPVDLPYIFDIFHRTRSGEKKDGYGIGLATARAIVEGHGGRIRVESELGVGTTFRVYIPKRAGASSDTSFHAPEDEQKK